MTPTETIVEATGIEKIYRTGTAMVEALRGVDVTVRAGEFVGIMGQSGAGKSTLMHILGCLDTPSQGNYLLAGQDVSCLSDRELSLIRASKIGIVFQAFNLIPRCTVLENVMMPFQYRNTNGSDVDVTLRARQAIERVGLASRETHTPSELSGGEMQRVAIARAIAVRPLLVLADEATGNLDSKTSEEILDLFSKLNEEGTTLIVVTHSERVASRCKRIVRLRDGRLES
jgi:putative ABC transport system ATP-binding protein